MARTVLCRTTIVAGRKATKKQQHGSGVVGDEGWASIGFGGQAATIPNQAFSYDANGNRTALIEGDVTYAYSNLAASNRLLGTAGPVAKTYGYDMAGNVVNDGIHAYSYDDRGRLTGIDSGVATYQHNGQGQRVRKDAGAVTLFVYDDSGRLLGEYDADGNGIREHVWFDGAPVAILSGVNVYYVHADHLGTPRAITDGDTVVWRWDSDPFGSAAPDEDPDGNSTSLTYNLRFPGQYYDEESGLHYNYYRTFDPSTGRYLESDPIGLQGGLNPYAYVGGDPLSFVDPTGLVKWKGTLQVDVIGYGKKVPVGKRRLPLGFELATIVTFDLESECKCGKVVTVSYDVEGVETGFFMFPAMAVRANLEMEDSLECPDGWNFGGEAFLDVAINATKKGGMIHFYDFLHETEFPEAKKKVQQAVRTAKRRFRTRLFRKTGSSGPRFYRICLDFWIY